MDSEISQTRSPGSFAVLLLAACNAAGGSGEPPPTSLPPLKADINIVSEGRVVPANSVELAFFSSGLVNEVLVEEGDLVQTGDVVARLGNREEIESAIANAKIELAEEENEKLKNGPDPDDLAAADARIQAAENLAGSRPGCPEQLELLATLDGAEQTQDLEVGARRFPPSSQAAHSRFDRRRPSRPTT